MKYFTKQLWANLNLGDRESAKKASKQWERNMKAYWDHVERVLTKLSMTTQRFIKNVHLHDGSLASFEIHEPVKSTGKKQSNFIEIGVWHPEKDYLYVLRYSHVRKCEVDYPSDTPLFSYEGCTFGEWGYDEFSLGKANFIRHEILFSSGATILIECRSFTYKRKSLE